MAQCRYAGCERQALPLSRLCERHLGMGAKESSATARHGTPKRGRVMKKAAKKAKSARRAK